MYVKYPEESDVEIKCQSRARQAEDFEKRYFDCLKLMHRIEEENQLLTSIRQEYKEILGRISDSSRQVILSMVDAGYTDMAINFYMTSIAPYGITNYLFVSLSARACEQLQRIIKGCSCFTYFDYEEGKHASIYFSSVFLQKMAMRSRFILDALKWGYNVLHTDLDITFMKNPQGHLRCTNCDLVSMEDGKKDLLNAGFIYIKATPTSIRVFTDLFETLFDKPESEDQAVLNDIVKVKMEKEVKWKLFNKTQFLSGKDYFENPKRYFAGHSSNCPDCVVVHNNWIVSKAAKVYRYKEMLMWMYDGDHDQYYTNINRKYLTYENALMTPWASNFSLHEKEALMNALSIGHMLNRIVILPSFHCSDDVSLCPLNSHIYISNFDDIFSGDYREHSFLRHPLVPETIKNNLSNMYYIVSTKRDNIKLGVRDGLSSDIIRLSPANPAQGAMPQEIVKWLGNITSSVLRLHSLYGVLALGNVKNDAYFEEKLTNAFKQAQYRQY